MNQVVEFDPGISKYFFDFNEFINDVYSQLMRFNSLSQKRARFRLYNNKIYSGLEKNIAFYQGCLLWAYYLSKTNKKSPKNITGNMYLELTPEQIKDYDYEMQVNFIENYFDSYERDTLYYMGTSVKIPEKWKKILALYNEFLNLNKGFVSTKTTDDIVLPDKLNKKVFDFDIKTLIDSAIEKEDLTLLLSVDLF